MFGSKVFTLCTGGDWRLERGIQLNTFSIVLRFSGLSELVPLKE
jgi:hypothetical protein